MTMDEAKLSEIEARANAATEEEAKVCLGCGLSPFWKHTPACPQFPDKTGEALSAAAAKARPGDLAALVAEVRRLREALAAAAIHARHKALEEAVDLVKGLAEDARDDGGGSDDAASLALEDAGEALLSLRSDS